VAHPGRRQHRNVQRASRRQAIVACAVRHARRVFERFRKVVSARFVVSLIGEAVLTAEEPVWCVTSFISRGGAVGAQPWRFWSSGLYSLVRRRRLSPSSVCRLQAGLRAACDEASRYTPIIEVCCRQPPEGVPRVLIGLSFSQGCMV